MAQHFLLSAQSHTFSIQKLFTMADTDILRLLKEARWGKSDNPNEIVCPRCGVQHITYFISSRQQWQCKHCQHHFSITAGTIFQGTKLTLRQILFALYLFSSEAKGLTAIKLSQQLGVQYKTAWLLLHKFRETLNLNKVLNPLEGEVHIDGAYCNFYIRPKNFKHRRIDRRAKRNQRKDKSCVMIFRQKAANQDIFKGADRSIVALVKEENSEDVLALTTRLVKPNSRICTDENSAYDNLNAYYNLERVNHSQEYCSIDGITNNLAESFFARLRRSQIGIHHKMSNKYLMLYANEMAWREDNRRKSVGEKLEGLLQCCMQTPPLHDFINYYQGNKKGKEKYGVESLGFTSNYCNYHLVA